jgi:hypothetical protein
VRRMGRVEVSNCFFPSKDDLLPQEQVLAYYSFHLVQASCTCDLPNPFIPHRSTDPSLSPTPTTKTIPKNRGPPQNTTQHTPSTPANLNIRTSTTASPTNPRAMDPADGQYICRCGQVFYLYEPLGDDRKWSPTHVHYRSDNTRLVGFGAAVFCWTYMICDYVRWRCSFKA